MRRFGWVLSATALVAVFGATSALAELRTRSPAEVPPLSFKGRQYVDSAGCVFVRAGYGKAVNWVPRVSRDRKHLCGYKPTFQNGETVLDVAKVAPAPAPQAAPAPVAAAKPAPVAAPTATMAAKPAPTAAVPTQTPRIAAKVQAPAPAAPKPASTPFVGRPMATIAEIETPPKIGLAQARPAEIKLAQAAPASSAAPGSASYVSPYVSGYAASPRASSVRYHNATPVPAPASAPAAKPVTSAPTIVSGMAVPGASTSCPTGTEVAQRYTLSDGRSVVRCGGKEPDPVTFINNAGVPGLVVAPSSASAPASASAPSPASPAPAYVSPYVSGGLSQNRAAPTAPLMGATAYAPTAATMAYETLPTAPMTAGTGYAVSGRAVSGGAVPQQVYASPYQSGARQSTPEAVNVRSSSGHTTLAPVLVGSKSAMESGYATAFEDGRLNPFRGPRSLLGDAEQGALWTNQVPARLVGAQTPPTRRIVPQAAPAVRVSAKATPVTVAPKAEAKTAPRYVQVGSFAVPGNAAAVKARLAAVGLPVSSSTTRQGLTVVYAGPFADAREALGPVRAAGFADVLLR